MNAGRIIGFGFSGVVLVALYRLTGFVGILVANEISQIIGQAMWLGPACTALGLLFFGALAEAYFWLRDRIG